MKKTKIIAVVGSTASGKSALAVALAKRHGGEIISCDSMQVYRGMDIGTAKPTADEQASVRHHMIDVADPLRDFSSAEYVSLAEQAIADCAARSKLPIVCGGTGLYLDALLRGNDFEVSGANETLRAELYAYAEKEGAEALHRMLREVDPESADAIHPNNVKRVIRALEIYYSCGVPKSVLDKQSTETESKYDAKVVGLFYPAREILYRRIEDRVDFMIEQGLVEETRSLMRDGVFQKNSTAAQAIGYKELLRYVKGEQSIDDAVAELKTATRRYAKRQITWFSAKKYVLPIEVTDQDNVKRFEEIVNNAQRLFSL